MRKNQRFQWKSKIKCNLIFTRYRYKQSVCLHFDFGNKVYKKKREFTIQNKDA